MLKLYFYEKIYVDGHKVTGYLFCFAKALFIKYFGNTKQFIIHFIMESMV